jgi:hypothetical protein
MESDKAEAELLGQRRQLETKMYLSFRVGAASERHTNLDEIII